MTASPALTIADEIVQDVVAGDMSTAHGLAELRSRNLTPDPVAFAEAVAALSDRQGLAEGLIDPLWWLEATPRPGLNALDTAVGLADEQYHEALTVLAHRQIQSVAS